nr:hypothetical protein [Tanacetum cinerariifolium]
MSGSGAGEMAPTSSKVMGHSLSFENKTGRGTRKCFKEVTTSLKDLHDDFSSNFNQDDVERLFEFLVPLRPPPRHLLYVCRLTTACRHPGLSFSIKDQDKNVISMDTFLKLPTWTGTIVSKEMPNTKIVAAREKKEKQSLPRAEAKRAGAGHAGGLKKKQKEVVDLSGNTCVSMPPVMANQPSPPLDHHDADENPDPNTQGELLKRHEQLNHDYVDLQNRRDTNLAELERLRSSFRKANQDNDEITKKFTLLDNAHLKCTS